MGHWIRASLLFGVLAAPSSAQELLYRWNGERESDRLGVDLDAAGDVDGDGVPDVLLGADHHDPAGLFDAGSAYVRSGATGELLWQFSGTEREMEYGIGACGLGDIDADGHADVGLGARGVSNEAGKVEWRSGRTGEVLFEFFGSNAGDRFGTALSGIGDVDRDGFPDAAVGVIRDDTAGPDAGAVYVYSGADGHLIHALYGESNQASFGQFVAALGDTDLDGHPDFLVGAPNEDHGGDRTGSAYVFSGQSGLTLLRVDGEASVNVLGTSGDGVGDLTNDGIPDFVCSAPNAGRGLVYVFSGADGSVVYRLSGGGRHDHLGSAVAGVGDVNADGMPDFMVSDGRFANDERGVVWLVSGRTGNTMYSWQGEHPEQSIGNDLAGVGDLDGDGFMDVLIGAQADDSLGSSSGSAFVHRGNDLFLQAPRRPPGEGETIALISSELAEGTPVLLMLERLGWQNPRVVLGGGRADSNGQWTYDYTVPPGFSGLELCFRSFASPGGSSLHSFIDSARTRVTLR